MSGHEQARRRHALQPGSGLYDVVDVCREIGAVCAPPRGGGSHYKVAHPSQSVILTIPYKRPIKPIYIRKLVAFIDAVRAVP